MTESICPKCSKPKVQGMHGSITQWMSSCACEIVVDSSAPQAISVTLCNTCGKRIEVGRSGSFTQWIFRSDKCVCEVPVPMQAPVKPASTGALVTQTPIEPAQSFAPDDNPDEPALQLDVEAFPASRYEALREIGQGAAGQVFLCRDRLLGARVALKRLHHVSSELLMQFQQEARATSKLSHPNIVKVLNFGATESGAPYMVMEFIEGVSVEEHLAKNGPLSSQDALSVIAQVADALSYSHSKSVFHRDIKSSNIILIDGEAGQPSVRIIDFGIAMLTRSRQEPTIVQGRTVVGTPAYMPPDQALGQTYDERSEVYSVGCIFFEAVAGKPPFFGKTALEVINKHAFEAVPRIAEINPDTDCTSEIEAIILTCLAKEKEERFQSMAELRDACAACGSPPLACNDNLLDEEPDKATHLVDFGKRGLLDGTWAKVAALLVALIVASVVGVVLEQASTNVSAPVLTKNKMSHNAGGYLEPAGQVRASIIKSLSLGESAYALNLLWAECHDDDLSVFDRTNVAGNVNLSQTNITDLGLKHFADSPLWSLNLEGTRVKTLEYLPARQTLRALILSNTRIGDPALAQLGVFEALRELRLNGTYVTANGIRQLKNLTLEVLELEECPNLSKADIEKLREDFPMWGVNRDPKINEIKDEILQLRLAHQHQKSMDVWGRWYQFSKTHPDGSARLAVLCLCGMGFEADSMKNFPLAKRYYTQALDIATKSGDELNLCTAYDSLHSHCAVMGKRGAAIQHGLKAILIHVKLYHEVPHRLGRTVGVELALERDYSRSLQLLQPTGAGLEKYLADVEKKPQAFPKADTKTIRLDIATVDVYIADCLMHSNRFGEAQQKLAEAQANLFELPDASRKPVLAHYYLIKAKLGYQSKNFEQSLLDCQVLMKLCRDKAADAEHMIPAARAQYVKNLKALGRHKDAEKFKSAKN